MGKDIGIFFVKLLGVSSLMFFVHFYILSQFFSGQLYLYLWQIYLFNATMVFGVYVTLRYYFSNKPESVLRIFLILTILKMALVIVFLIPLFLKKSAHTQLEVFNFFIPYFLYLIFEITALTRFLQKT